MTEYRHQRTDAPITPRRHRFAIGVTGGPTTVIDYGGLRFVTDPTFDPPGDYGAYRKSAPPASTPDDLGAVDAVLLSHDAHWDNFDHAGRAFARTAPLILTGRGGAARLGSPARGLGDFEAHVLHETNLHETDEVRVTAVPAQHGPADGDRDDDGNVNTEVHGFVLQSSGLPTVYVSGDNAGIGPVTAIAEAFPRVQIAVLHCGAARLPSKDAGRALTLTAARATDVATILGVESVVAVHHRGWSIYSENDRDLEREFFDAGLLDKLTPTVDGRWALV